MLRALWQALAGFLHHPATYMLAQAWLFVLVLWWTLQARRMARAFRFWFVPAGGLFWSHLLGLVLAWALLGSPSRYTPWWLLRVVQAFGAYFLLWAWMWPQDGRREVEWFRGGMALLALPAVPASLVLHTLGPSRWPGLETLWLGLGALTGLGALAVLLPQPESRDPWALTTAALLAAGFVADLLLPGDLRAGARMAEMAVYPLLLAWPEVHSPWPALQRRWRERETTQNQRLMALYARVQELEAQVEALRSGGVAMSQTRLQAWCERGGDPFWQAFADVLHMVHDTLDRFTTSAVWRTLPPTERSALLRLDAAAHFHRRALEVAAQPETETGEWRPWAHIWNRVLQDVGPFAQSRSQTLVLALPDEIFAWSAPEHPAYHALYFVLARALWVSAPQSEILVRGHVVTTEPGGLGVMLEITDYGPPLTEEEQVRVFFAVDEPMETPSDSLTAVGANLGLRLARRQLLAVQGGLWVVAAGDHGSTMAVLVPTRRGVVEDEVARATDAHHVPATA